MPVDITRMSTINSTLLGNTTSTSSDSSSSSSSSSTSSSATSSAYDLKPSDFITMMVTQLENQDPTQPTSNQDLLAQMSQIGQLQSSDDLQTTMQSVTLQTQVGSAATLIGKSVTGLDANNAPISGVVNSVAVAGGAVTLKLDDGSSMDLDQLSTIATSTSTATTGS